ncbi:Hypothetical protein FKW44_019674 [Caligus rogercresseyi]|uniref:Uncharacterized protein n=1 Tax=Caligus rogercresseyi TaxID=217165 RepID=A0A7T8JYA9_CALRO|nr:Hypothetical protein FKW44_019674 [Caligus rogercresseyi]
MGINTCRREIEEKEKQRRGTEVFVPGVAKADPGKRLQRETGHPEATADPGTTPYSTLQQSGRQQHLKNGPHPKQRRPSP